LYLPVPIISSCKKLAQIYLGRYSAHRSASSLVSWAQIRRGRHVIEALRSISVCEKTKMAHTSEDAVREADEAMPASQSRRSMRQGQVKR
jgi:hypothetical protein